MAVAEELRASGAEVSFLGTRDRVEAELVPAAGYEIDFVRARGIDRGNPLRAARRGARGAGRRRAPPRRVLRGAGPTSCSAAAGSSPARPGSPRSLSRTPLVLTEADSHLGLANRMLARAARRVCLSFPIAGRAGERYPVTGRPVPAAVLEADRAAARDRFEIEGGCLPSGDGRQPGRPLDQLLRDRSPGRARGPSVPRHPPGGPPRPRRAEQAPRGRAALRPLHAARLRARPRRRASPPATWCSGAPAGRSSRWPRRAGRRSSSPIRTPRRITRAPTPPGWRTPERRRWSPTRR